MESATVIERDRTSENVDRRIVLVRHRVEVVRIETVPIME